MRVILPVIFLFISLGLFGQGQDLISYWDSLIAIGKTEIIELDTANSEYGDYSAVQSYDTRVFFTSERLNNNTREQAVAFNQNIYHWEGKMKRAKYSYFYNSDDYTAVAGISSDLKTLYIYKSFNGGDLYYSNGLSNKDKLKKFKHFPYPLNTDNSQEQSLASWKDMYLLCSDRNSSDGKFDIFVSYEEDGKFTEPKIMDKFNTPANEMDVRILPDATILFSSNRDGRYKPYFARYVENDWPVVEEFTLIPDSFFVNDVRDLFITDSMILFSSKINGNYDVFCIRKPMDTITQIDTTELLYITADSFFVNIDTEIDEPDTLKLIVNLVQKDTILTQEYKDSVFAEQYNTLENTLDSLGFEKPYRAYVQVGAFYYTKSIEEYKRKFAAFDTTALFIETEQTTIGTLYKYLIDFKYMTLLDAAKRQQVALNQQASAQNKYESKVDAFIAVYDAKDRRIVIFFNVEKDEYKILIGDEVIYF